MGKTLKDQEFSGNICGFEVKMVLNNEGLILHYFHETDRSNIFEAHFPTSSTEPKFKEVKQVFRSLQTLYSYINDFSEDKKRISINDHGRFKIVVKRVAKNKKTSTVQFVGQRLLNKRDLKEQKMIQNGVSDVRQENEILKKELAALEKIYENYKIETAQLKRDVLLAKQQALLRIEKEKDILKTNQGQIRRKRKQNQEAIAAHSYQHLEQLTNNLKEEIKILTKNYNLSLSAISSKPYARNIAHSNQLINEEFQKYGTQHWVELDRNNRFLEGNYRIQGNTLIKVGIYSSFQVLGKDPIPLDGKHYFSVFIDRINWSIFSVGIANQNRRNYPTSHESKDCITYFAKNGTIWEQGICRGGGPMIQEGTEVRVVLDNRNYLIKWFMNGTEIGSTLIGENLKGRRLVPYVQLNYTNNRLTFNRQAEEKAIEVLQTV